MTRALPLSLPLFPSAPMADAKVPGIELRKYQQAVIDRLRHHVTDGGIKRALLVAPCASGKMVMMASMIRTSSLPVLFVAHRRELLNQLVAELARMGISHVSVIRGDDDRYDPSASVQIASIDSLRNRKPQAGRILVFIDEAHRAMSDGYQEHVFDAFPDAIIVGATASPCRLDGRPLGDRFEVMEQAASYGELIKQGHLIEPRVYGAPVIADLSGVRVNSSGEFDNDQLAQVMTQTHLRGQVVTQWLKLAHLHEDPRTGRHLPGERRRTLVFAVNVEHSRAIVRDFQAAGVLVAHLDGTTPDDERQSILGRLKSGELEVVSNVNVLLEGVDIPEIKCVVGARPTESLVLYIQSTNRALRLWNGVTPILIDHAGNRERHGFPTEDRAWSLKAPPQRYASAAPVRVCPICFLCNALSRHLCAGCFFEFPRAVAPRRMEIPVETKEDLVPVTPGDAERAFYLKQVLKAKSSGFKPKYPSAKFKEKYGRWPPNAWEFETDSLYAEDAHWQEAIVKRQREREFWGGAKTSECGNSGAMAPDPLASGGSEELAYCCNRCGCVTDGPGECASCTTPDGDPWGLVPVDGGDAAYAEEAPFADWLESEGIR